MSVPWSRWLAFAIDPDHARRVAILSQTALFAGLPRRLLGRLAAMLPEKTYATDDVIFFEGDPAQALFIVLAGNVDIVVAIPDGERRVAVCGPSTVFGELALVTELPRSATARATELTQLLILYHTDFEQLVRGNRRIACVVLQNLLRTLAGYVQSARAADVVPTAAPVDVQPPAGLGQSRAWAAARNL